METSKEDLAAMLASLCDVGNRIAVALEAIAQAQQLQAGAPDIKKSLKAYSGFDWASINAKMVRSDNHGATLVWWNGNLYTRRNGAGKFGNAIWFSRSVGKDDDGDNAYERLITFKDASASESEPLDSRIVNQLR